jgi:subtilisin family serine protease
MSMSLIKAVLATAVVGLAFAASHATASADAATVRGITHFTTGGPVPASPLSADRNFVTVDQAVTAGILDRRVVHELRQDGSAEAIVSVQYQSARQALGSKAFRARAEALEESFAVKEAAALRPAGQDVSVLRAYDSLPSTFVRFESLEAVLDVVNASEVTSIRANTPVPVALQQSLNVVRQPQAAAAGHTGAGTYVAVLDTGVDYTRAPFGCTAVGVPSTCKVALSREQDGDLEGLLDEGSFHGTNVAGIVASVAPGTKILAYDVFDWKLVDGKLELRSDPSDQLAAIQHAIDLKKAGWNVVAANLSLGGGWYTSSCNAGLNFALARDYGILPVVAAGNDGVVNGAYRAGIAAPACDANAISVGAVYDSSFGNAAWRNCTDSTTAQDKITCFSQTGPNLSLLAPGALITAAGITQGGTSQAAPHVAGAVAVLASAKYGSRLYYRAEAGQIDTALRTSGPSIYDPRSGVTRRRLDVSAALTTLLGSGNGGGDTTGPTVSTPVEQFDGPISSSGAVVKLSWSASDPSGIREYAVYSRANGGAWARETAIPATATSWRFLLAFGTKFEFAVQARDGAGNWSNHQYSPSLTPGYSDDKGWQLSGWSRYSWADAFGGTAISTSQAGASITHTFTGRDVALIAPLHATGGRAHVYCDGAFKATIDLYSATVKPREAAYWCRFPQYGQHTMKIVVEGTVGRPRVDVDAFAVLQ